VMCASKCSSPMRANCSNDSGNNPMQPTHRGRVPPHAIGTRSLNLARLRSVARDPLPSFGSRRKRRPFPKSNGYSLARVFCRLSASAVTRVFRIPATQRAEMRDRYDGTP
jgi:hypothetical protein